MKIAIKLQGKPEEEIIDGVVMVEEDYIDFLYHIAGKENGKPFHKVVPSRFVEYIIKIEGDKDNED